MANVSDVIGIIQVFSLVINMVVVLSGVVWTVGRIKGTTEVLNETIRNLSNAVTKLEQSVDKIEDSIGKHSERLAVLENK